MEQLAVGGSMEKEWAYIHLMDKERKGYLVKLETNLPFHKYSCSPSENVYRNEVEASLWQ